jgi:hypothetical protein
MATGPRRFDVTIAAGLWIAVAVASIGLVPATAAADPREISVYQSGLDDGVDTGPARVLGHTIVHVYFDPGSTAPLVAAEACEQNAGTSDEICQWAVRLATSGNLVIADVAWGDEDPIEDDEPTAPSDERDGTGGSAASGELGPTKLATVAVTGTYGDLRLFTPDGLPDTPGHFGFVDEDGGAPASSSAGGWPGAGRLRPPVPIARSSRARTSAARSSSTTRSPAGAPTRRFRAARTCSSPRDRARHPRTSAA